jgi:hypothetical protein
VRERISPGVAIRVTHPGRCVTQPKGGSSVLMGPRRLEPTVAPRFVRPSRSARRSKWLLPRAGRHTQPLSELSWTPSSPGRARAPPSDARDDADTAHLLSRQSSVYYLRQSSAARQRRLSQGTKIFFLVRNIDDEFGGKPVRGLLFFGIKYARPRRQLPFRCPCELLYSQQHLK